MHEAPRHDSRLAQDVAEFCKKHVTQAQQSRASFPSSPLWAGVAKTGTALWLDTGDVDAARALWVREFTALTTNNTLLNKEVQKGIYDQLVPGTAALLRASDAKMSSDQLVQEIAFVLNAVHGLKLVRTFDADVSVELHTAISNDAEASYRYGKRFAAISPDRFIVKVPLTPAGLLAARRLHDDGIRLNFTLGFSARQNWLIASLAQPTFCNVFMGRINAFIADNKLGDGANAGEKATLASQRGLRRLEQKTKREVRQIGASMRSGQQCADLLGLDVFTMPTAAAKEFVAMNPALAALKDKTANDPAVTFAAGIDASKERLDVCWTITPAFEAAAAAAARLDATKATADDVKKTLAANGAGDLFPQFTADEAARVAKEGKIPVFKSWSERVRAGTASWDGMLTAAALASFTQDQQALDDRIRKQL
ncbi:MAG TPA: transaldolase family protein [Planctomycetota bacterium]|nr:transaldolase family protein [Planctomycetota bacterium]